MLKNILFASAFISTAIAFPGQFKIKDSNVFSPKELGLVSLTHDDSGFYVIHNGVKRSVKSHNVDKDLRNRPSHKIEKFLQHGYISVNKMSDGDFVINSKVRGNGGGYWGAQLGFWGGKFAVNLIGHGSIAVVSCGVGIFCAPAGYALGTALEATLAPVIEVASNVGGIGCAVALGSSTGPI